MAKNSGTPPKRNATSPKRSARNAASPKRSATPTKLSATPPKRSATPPKRAVASPLATNPKPSEPRYVSSLDKLQKDAQRSELDFTNTSPATFVLLSLVQVPNTLIISYAISPSTASPFLLNRFSRMALANITCHWVGFAIAVAINSVKWFDVTEDVTYFFNILWMLTTIETPSPRQTLVHLLAMLWCVRICAFVGYRIYIRGSDFRFDKLNRAWAYQLFGWTSGGTWCWANGFCVWHVADADQSAPLGAADYLGLSIFAFGLVFELVADVQKYRFNSAHAAGNNKAWINTGLWSLCRHPNYFGENVLWLGIAIIAMSRQFSAYSVGVCLVTPLWSFVFLLFTSLMLLEKRADARWASDSEYLNYKATTNVWLPSLAGARGALKRARRPA